MLFIKVIFVVLFCVSMFSCYLTDNRVPGYQTCTWDSDIETARVREYSCWFFGWSTGRASGLLKAGCGELTGAFARLIAPVVTHLKLQNLDSYWLTQLHLKIWSLKRREREREREREMLYLLIVLV